MFYVPVYDSSIVPTLFSFSEERTAAMERVWRGIAGRMDKHRALSKDARAWFRKCHRAGVRFAAGSDVYRTLGGYYGRNAIELEHLVRNGVFAMEALVAATKVTAEAIGLDEVGTLRKGRRADLLLVNGDPTTDIRILQDAHKLADGDERRRGRGVPITARSLLRCETPTFFRS